jgi:major histocompatibility complex class I
MKPETLKLKKEKVEKSLERLGKGGKFLNTTTMACAVRSRIHKGMVAHAFNPSTREAEAGGFLSSRPAWSTK